MATLSKKAWKLAVLDAYPTPAMRDPKDPVNGEFEVYPGPGPTFRQQVAAQVFAALVKDNGSYLLQQEGAEEALAERAITTTDIFLEKLANDEPVQEGDIGSKPAVPVE